MRTNIIKYQSQNPLQQFLIRRFLKKVRTIVSALPVGLICDLGCGEGFVLKDLISHGACQACDVTAVDIDEEALEFASASLRGVTMVKASGDQLPFQPKVFQNLLLLEVLEHLKDPRSCLSEVSRVSRMLVVSVPHEPFFQVANFLRGKNLRCWGNDAGHIQHWGKRSFCELLKPYGTILQVELSFPWLIAVVKIF